MYIQPEKNIGNRDPVYFDGTTPSHAQDKGQNNLLWAGQRHQQEPWQQVGLLSRSFHRTKQHTKR